MSVNNLPPQNIEAEESILGGILLDPEAIGRVADLLLPEALYIPAHRDIYKAALALHRQGKPTDLMSVTSWLYDHEILDKIGGQSKLAQLVDRTVSAVNIDRYANLVIEKHLRRQLIKAGNEIVQLGYENAIELESVFDQSEQKIFGLTQDRPQDGLISISRTLEQTFQDIETRHGGQALPGLLSGFYDLDAMTSGFQRSDFIVVAGRPSMGKTALAISIARSIAGQYELPVVVFSLEMSREQLVQRMLASEAGIESNYLRAGRIAQNQWEALNNALGILSGVPIFIDDTASMNVMQMRSQTRRLQAEHGGKLGLILIDYLQLMEGNGSDNRVQEISKITRSLKGLARELNVPVIALSQLSRSVEARNNKRPMMSDLRESGCLTGDSLVTLADSGLEVPIQELVGQSGFAVWGLNIKTGQQERSIATNAFCTGIKPVWEMTTNRGNSIKATANHQFYTLAGWKRLDELVVGDRIAMPRSIPSPVNQTMSNAELALLGHLIGDGCTLPRHSIQYTTRELDLAELVAGLAKEVFGDQISPRIHPERDWYQVYLTASYRLTHGVKNPITRWLESLEVFGLRSYEKFIPSLVFSQPKEAIALFLRHLWATDGCIKPTKGKKCLYPSIYYASSSEKLARGVKSLLLRLNINANIRTVSQGKKGRNQYHVSLGGKSDLEQFVNLVGAVGKYKQDSLGLVNLYLQNSGHTNPKQDLIPNEIWQAQVNIAGKKLGLTARQMQDRLGMRYCGDGVYKCDLSRERVFELGTILGSKDLLRLSDNDIYWDKVKKIDFVGEEIVYDLTIERNENFAVQGFYAHNSIEQDADVVIMLYRDEYYNPDTPDRGIAEICITKHRNGPTGVVKLLFDPQFTRFRNIANPGR